MQKLLITQGITRILRQRADYGGGFVFDQFQTMARQLLLWHPSQNKGRFE